MNRSTIDLWVGIFVAIGFGAILFLALKVGNLLTLDRSPGYHLEASFENIGGLKLRAPVKAAGVVVGRVERVRLDPKNYDAVVTMRLDDDYQFSKDTIAAINTSGLLGEVYIGLDAGGDPQMLKEGDRITKTQSAVVIEKLISQFLFEKASEGAGKDQGANKAAPAPGGKGAAPAPAGKEAAPAPAGKAIEGAKK